MRLPLVFLVALLAAAPLALAQGPLPAPCGPISVPAPPVAPDPVAPGGEADLVVGVSNDGSIPATVTVSASTTAQGWELGEAPAAVSIPAGESRTFTFRIQAREDDPASAADVTFSASAVCNQQLPTCPANACAAGPVVTQVRVPLAADEGLSIPLLDDLDIPLELLVAAVVLVGLASAIPFLMRRSKGGVVAHCPEPLKMVKPGRGTSFPIELRNATKAAAAAQFEVAAVPEGWSAFMPLPEVQLAPRESRSLWLMVRSPATAANGDAVDVELRLRARDGKESALVRVRAEVQGAEDA